MTSGSSKCSAHVHMIFINTSSVVEIGGLNVKAERSKYHFFTSTTYSGISMQHFLKIHCDTRGCSIAVYKLHDVQEHTMYNTSLYTVFRRKQPLP